MESHDHASPHANRRRGTRPKTHADVATTARTKHSWFISPRSAARVATTGGAGCAKIGESRHGCHRDVAATTSLSMTRSGTVMQRIDALPPVMVDSVDDARIRPHC